MIGVGITTPYPGTILWQICREHNLIPRDINYAILCPDPRFGIITDRTVCDTMSKKDFKKLFLDIIQQVNEIKVARGSYSLMKLIRLSLGRPFYALSLFMRNPKRVFKLFLKS